MSMQWLFRIPQAIDLNATVNLPNAVIHLLHMSIDIATQAQLSQSFGPRQCCSRHLAYFYFVLLVLFVSRCCFF